MKMRLLTFWFVVWAVLIIVLMPKPKDKIEKHNNSLELPTMESLINEEVERLERQSRIKQVEEYREKLKEERRQKKIINRGNNLGMFTVTSYDLTVASCSKPRSHPQYGITRSGYSLVGQDRESAMTIATDSRVIPLGTKVHIEFIDEGWKHWSGIYTARDTGSAIKGKRIDIFYKDTGDNKTDQVVWEFGKRKAKVTILKDEN